MYIEDFHSQSQKKDILPPEKQELIDDNGMMEEKLIGAPHEGVIEKHPYDTLIHWKAPEFEMVERDNKWLIYVTISLILIVAYAIYTNSIIMAITFILLGIVGYMHFEREPRILTFRITPDGVAAGRELYLFSNISSFWIFYEPEGKKLISLHTNSYLTPFVHMPIHEEDPVEIREVLLKYIPEVKQEPGIVDAFERLLGI